MLVTGLKYHAVSSRLSVSYIFFILVRCSLAVEGNFYMILTLGKMKVYFFNWGNISL